jgi:hypothetical protein
MAGSDVAPGSHRTARSPRPDGRAAVERESHDSGPGPIRHDDDEKDQNPWNERGPNTGASTVSTSTARDLNLNTAKTVAAWTLLRQIQHVNTVSREVGEKPSLIAYPAAYTLWILGQVVGRSQHFCTMNHVSVLAKPPRVRWSVLGP